MAIRSTSLEGRGGRTVSKDTLAITDLVKLLSGKERVSLGVVVTTGHFHELHLAIKCHHLDAMGRRILDLRDLLAGVGIDNSAWIDSQRLNQLNLRLEGKEGGIGGGGGETMPTVR